MYCGWRRVLFIILFIISFQLLFLCLCSVCLSQNLLILFNLSLAVFILYLLLHFCSFPFFAHHVSFLAYFVSILSSLSFTLIKVLFNTSSHLKYVHLYKHQLFPVPYSTHEFPLKSDLLCSSLVLTFCSHQPQCF
jgi:hypothetical protein